jgi:hypothetical protein
MPRSKKDIDLQAFHNAAKKAASDGMTAKTFAKAMGTLANNVKAMLYEAYIRYDLKPVEFAEPSRRSRSRKEEPGNLSEITLYTGRAKDPYLTLKVPKGIVGRSGANEGDVFEWRLNRKGSIVGHNVTQNGNASEAD